MTVARPKKKGERASEKESCDLRLNPGPTAVPQSEDLRSNVETDMVTMMPSIARNSFLISQFESGYRKQMNM